MQMCTHILLNVLGLLYVIIIEHHVVTEFKMLKINCATNVFEELLFLS